MATYTHPQPHDPSSQPYDPTQVQSYTDQTTQQYYAYPQYDPQQQQYAYYYPDYANPNAYHHQQSQVDPNSVQPPGVQPDPAQAHQGYYYPYGSGDPNAAQQQGQQWQQPPPPQNGGYGAVPGSGQAAPVVGGPGYVHPPVGQSQYRGGGGGRRGGGRGPFRGGSFRGRGGRGVRVAAPPKPPRMAWCEVCRVDCNTDEILEKHKSGKKHKKNLQTIEELQNLNKIMVEMQNPQEPTGKPDEKPDGAEEKQPTQENLPTEESAKKPRAGQFGGRGRGAKRPMRGGRGGKRMRTGEGPGGPSSAPVTCEVCQIVCNSQVVYDNHLTGRRHHMNLKTFRGPALGPTHQVSFGGVGLQALYPPNPNNPYLPPVIHQQGVHGPLELLTQLAVHMVQAQAQVQAPQFGLGPITLQPQGPHISIEVKNEAMNLRQVVTTEDEAQPAASTDAKDENETADVEKVVLATEPEKVETEKVETEKAETERVEAETEKVEAEAEALPQGEAVSSEAGLEKPEAKEEATKEEA